MKTNKSKLEKETLVATMQLEAVALRQGNKSEHDLWLAQVLDAAAKRIEHLEGRLRKRPASY